MDLYRDRLVAAALHALRNTGVRRTTVRDLAAAAGLSTGAFYKFFPSKEALFFEVYDQAEERIKAEFTAALQSSQQVTPPTLQLAVKQLLRSESAQALLHLIRTDEMDYLIGSLDAERMEQHRQKDLAFVQHVLGALRSRGLHVKIGVELLQDFVQALLVLYYEHDQYAQHADTIIDAFIDTLVGQAIA
jgi:AcrR family transcriptional regulator